MPSEIKINKMDFPTCTEIISGLYIGDYRVASDLSRLQNHKITHIIIAADGLEVQFPTLITYKLFPILDVLDQDIIQYFDESIDFIDAALIQGGKVLVHW